MAGKLNTPVYPTRAEHGLQLRIQLLALLAPASCCAACRSATELEDLEVDHLDGRTWSWHSLNALDRIRREWRELAAGVRLRALCRRCNGSDGVRFRGKPRYARKPEVSPAAEARAA
jgi:hypothetical protein